MLHGFEQIHYDGEDSMFGLITFLHKCMYACILKVSGHLLIYFKTLLLQIATVMILNCVTCIISE